ncbi:hypothetical protein [Streptomyces nigrescens]|uniref:Uncharacterized protein n=1 Tax=Streptomyces nigrescens TaxID=1920 RepID=A0A640T9K5_STRNI|nr:hypothetical protein [Streptomyces libani]WAT94862.1 hypothetical protein STRLI_000534 [Streptomyces libani subsp. libani]GFE20008.1 hypothetical protein Sliba_04610 [Streptomyces libani subsp. libani]GGV85544.1 hypothetical protein GCM10010500_02140 [Streptomyces libani subsp. libani]
MPHPDSGYYPQTVVHQIRVVDLQTDSPLFAYTAELQLDGRGQGVTTELLDRVTQTIAAYAAEQLVDAGGTQETRATLSYTGVCDLVLLPGPEA